MTLFILTETSAGYALLKAKDKKILKRDDLASETESAEGICSLYVNITLVTSINSIIEPVLDAELAGPIALDQLRDRADTAFVLAG